MELASDVLRSEQLQSFTSQHGQDFFLYNIFLKGNTDLKDPTPTYVDLASYKPKDYSNSYFLDVCLGWSGLCIEGNPNNLAGYADTRSCFLENSAVAEKTGPVIFEAFDVYGGIKGHNKVSVTSEVNEQFQKEGSTIEVPGKTFGNILSEQKISHVHFLSLDVEGAEFIALKTLNFQTTRIDMIVAECTDDTEKLHSLLKQAGYVNVGRLKNTQDDWFIHKSAAWALSRLDEKKELMKTLGFQFYQ